MIITGPDITTQSQRGECIEREELRSTQGRSRCDDYSTTTDGR